MITDAHDHTTRCWWNPAQAEWECRSELTPPGHEAAVAGPDRPLVDVRDMIVVHTALLREFRLAPSAVARVDAGAVRRAAVVDRHLGFLCELLHHHHAGEDALLWPPLRERAPAAAAKFIDDVEGQHVEIDSALQAVTAARAEWVRDASPATRDTLVAQLARLHALLEEHLELEERSLLPLAASVLTEAEWHAVGEAAVASMPKPALLLAFGMFAYEGDPAVLRDMLRTAPALPRLLLPRIAPRVFARRANQVHGTARP